MTAAPVPALDPRWLRNYWPVFFFGVLAAFGLPETLGLVFPGVGGTLSEQTRDWLGVSPDGETAGGRYWAFVVAWTGLAVWYPVHLRKRWPWERGIVATS